MAQGVFTPYSTVVPFAGASKAPSWVPADDAERILSYQIYEEMYWNHNETFRLTLRGDEERPIYVPSGRIICDAADRFTAPDLDFVYQGTNPTDVATLQNFLDPLFAREKMRSKFNSLKLFGIIRGDALLHVRADPTKPQGRRLRINVVDPASYFPVYDDDDLDRVIRVHLVEQFTADDGKVFVKKQTYEYDEQGQVISSCGIYEPDKWTAADARPVQEILPPTPLPSQITTIPVYHFRNKYEEGNPFGSSEMRGLERLSAAINQTLTDEDIALALEGLGVYKSGGGAPVDENGDETDWIIGPGRVIEDPTFERVTGIQTTGPYLNHMERIWQFLLTSSGTPEVAVGKVDVSIAESGISLLLQMSPLLANAKKKVVELKDVMIQFLFDLQTMWMPAYEGVTVDPTAALVLASFGDPLPVDEKGEIDKYATLVAAGLMSVATAQENLTKKGIQFAADELARIAQEKALAAEAALASADPYAARVGAEGGDQGGAGNDSGQ